MQDGLEGRRCPRSFYPRVNASLWGRPSSRSRGRLALDLAPSMPHRCLSLSAPLRAALRSTCSPHCLFQEYITRAHAPGTPSTRPLLFARSLALPPPPLLSPLLTPHTPQAGWPLLCTPTIGQQRSRKYRYACTSSTTSSATSLFLLSILCIGDLCIFRQFFGFLDEPHARIKQNGVWWVFFGPQKE